MSTIPLSSIVLASGSVLAFLAVLAGAFGAHGLKNTLSEYEMEIFRTAVQYHMMHALGILLIGVLMRQSPALASAGIAWLMLAGIVLFSGSLYALAISGHKWLGMVTPIGGLCFLLAWLWLCISIVRATSASY